MKKNKKGVPFYETPCIRANNGKITFF